VGFASSLRANKGFIKLVRKKIHHSATIPLNICICICVCMCTCMCVRATGTPLEVRLSLSCMYIRMYHIGCARCNTECSPGVARGAREVGVRWEPAGGAIVSCLSRPRSPHHRLKALPNDHICGTCSYHRSIRSWPNYVR